MTANEMRELDAWIAEHVMGWKNDVENSGYYFAGNHTKMIDAHDWQPTTDPNNAVQVLKRCAEKAWEDMQLICIRPMGKDGWGVFMRDYVNQMAIAAIFELAICLFAKKLFSKPQ